MAAPTWQPDGLFLLELAYLLLLIFTCFRIVYDTKSVSKTLAYLLFAIFVPIVGILFYFSFGINYRIRKIYYKKLHIDEAFKQEMNTLLEAESLDEAIERSSDLQNSQRLIRLMASAKSNRAFLLPNNAIRLLQNGEEKFPALLEDLRQAKHHIHIEYYIFENDQIGGQIKEILIAKAKEGIKVRLIYDDFGAKAIRNNIVKDLQRQGVEVFPFNKIRLLLLANRLNYRNHRKIVVIDGLTAYVGGINISDRYINTKGSAFWRDLHLRIQGTGALALQRIFISDWNFCSGQSILVTGNKLFPYQQMPHYGSVKMQVISSGPDSDTPNILFATLQAIQSARQEILLCSPYFIPDESLQQSLVMAALGGIKIKLMVPEKSDSKVVDFVSRIYFEELLQAGVEIYLYGKGMLHAKSFVVDTAVASVGTANLDLRSFDLNFEVSTLIYDVEIAQQLKATFERDLKYCKQLRYTRWLKRSVWIKGLEKVLRLISPFM